jgi:hypothetical protein
MISKKKSELTPFAIVDRAKRPSLSGCHHGKICPAYFVSCSLRPFLVSCVSNEFRSAALSSATDTRLAVIISAAVDLKAQLGELNELREWVSKELPAASEIGEQKKPAGTDQRASYCQSIHEQCRRPVQAAIAIARAAIRS